MSRTYDSLPEPDDRAREIDLRGFAAALRRRRGLLVLVPLLALVAITIFVTVFPARYTAQSQVLLENQETFFTRPDRVNLQPEQPMVLDPEAVASQVQLMTSRDIARRAIKELGLEGNEEFDPLAKGIGPLKQVGILLGLVPDPTHESRDARIVTAFLEKLTVYSPPKTRVIAIEFTSRDPDLAARAANIVAALYIKEQSAAKRATAKGAADALAVQNADLKAKLVKAGDELEQYRLASGLLAGNNNMTITGQQLADINSDLSKARTSQADAQAQASMIRELLRSGRAADIADVLNNDIVRRVAEQRVAAQAQLALEARTLLPGHPRIKALAAQVAEYDIALKNAAKQAAAALENQAKIAGTRVANLEAILAKQKTLAGTANADEVHLHALERAAQGLKDQLDSSTAKYEEALARQSSDATPADARIIQRAMPPQEPSFPKKIPFIVFGTIAALVFTIGFVVAAEMVSGPDVAARPVVVPVEEDEATERPAHDPMPEAPVRVPAVAARPRSSFFKERADAFSDGAEDDDLIFPPAAETSPTRRPTVSALQAIGAGGVVGSVFARLKAFGRSAIQSRDAADEAREPIADHDGAVGWDDRRPVAPVPPLAPEAPQTARQEAVAIAERIAATHVPGRGVHVVGATLMGATLTGATLTGATLMGPSGADGGATSVLVDLSRALSDKGRSIVVDLNRTPAKLAVLAPTGGDGQPRIADMAGLAELLAGDASFPEVIHRDHASRLHFIPTGRQEADFRDFDLILDALTETYDFIVLLAPAYPQSEIARIMAPYADYLVLSAAGEPDRRVLSKLETELMEAGAHEVIVAGVAARAARQDVA